MKVLAVIPARGGSKGIPKKNIVDLNGKPLIQYTIEAVQKSQKVDKIFLSSDDDEIIEVSKKLGVYSSYKRPPELSSDISTTHDAISDALKWLEENEGYKPDFVLVLQPTSPLRISQDIDNSIDLCIKNKKDCLVSVHEMIEHPYECVYNIGKDETWEYLSKPDKNAARRQDYKQQFYYINGSIYLVNVDFFKKENLFIKENNTSFYVMPHEHGIDIDEYSDLKRAEFLLKDPK